MQVLAEAMAYQFPDNAIAIGLRRMFFYRVGDIPDPPPGDSLLDPLVQRFLRHADQLVYLRSRVTDGKGIGMISMPAFLDDTNVDGDDISFFECEIVGKAMH